MVEVHRQHNLRLQAGREPHPTRGPNPVGACQGRGLQMPQDQAGQEVPAAGQRRGFAGPERCGGGQGQPGHPVEGHVGPQAPEVSAAGEERQVQEGLGGGGGGAGAGETTSRGDQEGTTQSWTDRRTDGGMGLKQRKD